MIFKSTVHVVTGLRDERITFLRKGHKLQDTLGMNLQMISDKIIQVIRPFNIMS